METSLTSRRNLPTATPPNRRELSILIVTCHQPPLQRLPSPGIDCLTSSATSHQGWSGSPAQLPRRFGFYRNAKFTCPLRASPDASPTSVLEGRHQARRACPHSSRIPCADNQPLFGTTYAHLACAHPHSPRTLALYWHPPSPYHVPLPSACCVCAACITDPTLCACRLSRRASLVPMMPSQVDTHATTRQGLTSESLYHSSPVVTALAESPFRHDPLGIHALKVSFDSSTLMFYYFSKSFLYSSPPSSDKLRQGKTDYRIEILMHPLSPAQSVG